MGGISGAWGSLEGIKGVWGNFGGIWEGMGLQGRSKKFRGDLGGVGGEFRGTGEISGGIWGEIEGFGRDLGNIPA